jgi:hypothetical protein
MQQLLTFKDLKKRVSLEATAVVVFAAPDDAVIFLGLGEMPHTLDVSFTNFSFGSHIAAFCSSVNDEDVILLFSLP